MAENRSKGRFGVHGGQYIPETLMNAVIELEEAYNHYKEDPEFHRELDAIWQQGVLKGRYPLTAADTKTISRLPGVRRAVAAPRGHAKSTNLTFKRSEEHTSELQSL
mgnify:CR=1 FL=1